VTIRSHLKQTQTYFSTQTGSVICSAKELTPSAISRNADNQSGKAEAILLFKIDHRISASLPHENEVVGIEGISRNKEKVIDFGT
jgi:hypothetical protein